MQQLQHINENIKNTCGFVQQLIGEIERIWELEEKCEKEIITLKASLSKIHKEKQKNLEATYKLTNESNYVRRDYNCRNEVQFIKHLGYTLIELIFLESTNAFKAKLSYNSNCLATFVLHNDKSYCELLEVSPEIANFKVVQDFFLTTQDFIGFLITLREYFNELL